MTIGEDAIRESFQDKIISIQHIISLFNITDIFTQKNRDTAIFAVIRDVITSLVPDTPYLSPNSE